jgi:radical SAM superfamily enzyme YgiQ (UPF0313 family)
MRVLLLRPISPNERFGLGPFFKVEPLGLEYVAQALLCEGHEVAIVDLRFSRSLSSVLSRFRPGLVGIACTHTVDVPAALSVAAQVKRRDRSVFTLVGGHAAGISPTPLLCADVDAVCVHDGEEAAAALVGAVERGSGLRKIPGLLIRQGDEAGPEAFAATPQPPERPSLDAVPLPARQLVAPFQKHYFCVHKTPLWAVETTRGCPYRCSFCSIWRHQGRSFRTRSVGAVCTDLAAAGNNVFIVDDLFWHPRGRSLELARELARRQVKKDWMLVQARLDTAARNPELLEAWRPLAEQFDIFFGFETPHDAELAALDKDMTLSEAEEGIRVARSLGYGVTGNFVVDPDWDEADFEAMWAMVDRLDLSRAGYTVLTPLPGTPLYDAQQGRLLERDWARYDMHHILFEPRLGRERFFELFVKSWRRNVLSRDHSGGKWLNWFRQLSVRQALALARVLWHTQRMLRVDAYLAESFPLQIPAGPHDTQT